jgi:hypothetical protein
MPSFFLGTTENLSTSGFVKAAYHPFVPGELNSADIDYLWALIGHYDTNLAFLKSQHKKYDGFEAMGKRQEAADILNNPANTQAFAVLKDLSLLIMTALNGALGKRADHSDAPPDPYNIRVDQKSLFDSAQKYAASFYTLSDSLWGNLENPWDHSKKSFALVPYVPQVAGTGVPPFIVGSVMAPDLATLRSMYTISTSTPGVEYGELSPEQTFTETQYTVPNIKAVYDKGIPVLQTQPPVMATSFTNKKTTAAETKNTMLKTAAIAALAVGGIYLATR